MGFNHATTKLTTALFTTLFAVGFCTSSSSLIYIASQATPIGLTYNYIAYLCALFVGSVLAWPMSNWLGMGRRISTLVGLLVLFLGCVLATSLMSYGQGIAAEVFYGLGVGIMSVSAVLWMVEMAEARERGKKVVLLFIALSAGVAIAEWIDYGFQYVSSSSAYDVRWRVPLGLQLVVLMFPIFFVWRADESWRWLLQREQHDRARAILADHMSTSQADPALQAAFAGLVHQHDQNSSSRTLFSSKHSTPSSPQLRPWRRLLLACFLQTMRVLCGLPTSQYYLYNASNFLAGYQTRYPLVSALPTFTFLFTLIPYLLIDRPSFGMISPFGRRGLLMLSAFGLFAMFLLATIVAAATGNFSIYAWYSGNLSNGLLAGYVVLFLFASLFYSVGFRVVTDLYTAEIAASNVRTETFTIATAWGVALDVAIAFGNGYGVAFLGKYMFLIWLVLNVVWVVVIFLFYPETQGRSLEGLDGMFAGGLKMLAGTDKSARSGTRVGQGVQEFEVLEESDGVMHGIASELSEGPHDGALSAGTDAEGGRK